MSPRECLTEVQILLAIFQSLHLLQLPLLIMTMCSGPATLRDPSFRNSHQALGPLLCQAVWWALAKMWITCLHVHNILLEGYQMSLFITQHLKVFNETVLSVGT